MTRVTREQAHQMVEQWCAPHLWAAKYHAVDILFDFYEAMERERVRNDPLWHYPDMCVPMFAAFQEWQ